MIKHIWSILCRTSVINDETNNITLQNVFEQLSVNIKPSGSKKTPEKINIPIEYELVSLWLRFKEKGLLKANVVIDIIDPKGQKIKSFEQKLEFPTKYKRMRSRLKIKGLNLTTSGNYIYRVKIKEKGKDKYQLVADLPLEINLNKIKGKNTNSKLNVKP